MRSNSFRSLLLISAIGFILFGCTKAVIIEPGNTSPINRIIKYDPDVQNILFNHCITCHGGTAPSASLSLTNYENARFSTEDGNLLSRINSTTSPMPPSGLLSEENRQIIAKWVEDGYLRD